MLHQCELWNFYHILNFFSLLFGGKLKISAFLSGKNHRETVSVRLNMLGKYEKKSFRSWRPPNTRIMNHAGIFVRRFFFCARRHIESKWLCHHTQIVLLDQESKNNMTFKFFSWNIWKTIIFEQVSSNFFLFILKSFASLCFSLNFGRSLPTLFSALQQQT